MSSRKAPARAPSRRHGRAACARPGTAVLRPWSPAVTSIWPVLPSSSAPVKAPNELVEPHGQTSPARTPHPPRTAQRPRVRLVVDLEPARARSFQTPRSLTVAADRAQPGAHVVPDAAGGAGAGRE